MDFLQNSLEQLNGITNEVYNDQICAVALDLWRKHLSPDNPQWNFITAKPFYIKGARESAHVMAMIDKRLQGVGIVGYFACTEQEAGTIVLEQASQWLRSMHTIKNVYGPINGTLPSDYRLNLNDNFGFPGEPVNPSWYIDAFKSAGFTVFNKYESGISSLWLIKMKIALSRPSKVHDYVTTRPFNIDDYDKDFEIYHELRNAIFPFQSVYCPAISLEERYYNSSGKFDPRYTYFLSDRGRDIGFIMAYPYEDRLILKTIGILPEYQGKDLSSLLLKPIYEHAKKDGIHKVIYGMVRVGNVIHKTKNPSVKIFRHYVTMHRTV